MTECAGTAPEPAPVTEPAEEPEPEPQQKSNTGTLLLILAVAVLGSGAGWYFKIYRPKHEKAAVPEEDYSEELADYDDPEDDGRLGTRTIPKARIMNEIYQQPL